MHALHTLASPQPHTTHTGCVGGGDGGVNTGTRRRMRPCLTTSWLPLTVQWLPSESSARRTLARRAHSRLRRCWSSTRCFHSHPVSLQPLLPRATMSYQQKNQTSLKNVFLEILDFVRFFSEKFGQNLEKKSSI